MPELIKTKEKFFGLKIHIESTGIKKVDEAILTLFHDEFNHTAPLLMSRQDAQIVLAWTKGEYKEETLF